ncbi:MAG: efflux RND transporter periplasmic adaptor subunit [Planctomycetota bacterium]|jgi:RND family efflux transporter MFP subunit
MNVEALKIDRSKPPRPKRGRTGAWVFRSVVLLLVVGAVWLFHRPILAFVDEIRLPAVRVVQVIESHPATVSAVSGAAANGHIVAARRAALSADTPGRIIEMNVTEGSVVKKGFVVARLYAEEYAAALQRAEADLRAAKAEVGRAGAALASAKSDVDQEERNRQVAQAEVDEAKAVRKLAQVRHDRVIRLLEKGVSSQADVDDAEAALDTAKAKVASAEARLHAAASEVKDANHRAEVAAANIKFADARVSVSKATRDQAAATLDKTFVRAPFAGIVVLKDAEVGEVVSPNSQSGGSARGAVCTMVDFDSLEVQAEVPETSLSQVQLGALANVYLDAYPEQKYPGQVDRIWPTANRQKATVEVRIRFLERDKKLRPEMGVRVVFLAAKQPGDQIPQEPSAPQILIPENTVVEIAGKAGVFVLERDIARFQEVAVGERRAGRVQVQKGLRPGQRIVVDPPSSLQDGARVRVQKGP